MSVKTSIQAILGCRDPFGGHQGMMYQGMHSGSFQHQVLLRDLPVSGSPLTAASSKGVSSILASSGQKDTKIFIHGILLISVFSLFKRDFSHLKPSLPLVEDQTILSLHPKLPRPFLAPAVTPRVFHSDTLFHTSFTLSCTNTQQLSSD